MPKVRSTLRHNGFNQLNRKDTGKQVKPEEEILNEVNRVESIRKRKQVSLTEVDDMFPDNAISGNKLNTYDTGNAGVTSIGDKDADIRFWAGSRFENRSTAPFRVYKDGSVVMTDATITGKILTTFTAGETIAAGDILYFKTSDSEVYKALADGADFEHIDNLVGVANESGTDGNEIEVQLFIGSISGLTDTDGNFLTIGSVYFLDDTNAGKVNKEAGFYKVKIGIAISTSEIILDKDVVFDLFGGTGTDGALSVSSGTTTLVAGQVYNYSSISMTGGTLAFSGSNEPVIINCSGDCDLTGGTIELRYRNTSQIFVQTNKGTQARSGSSMAAHNPNVGGVSMAAADPSAGAGGAGGDSDAASASPGIGGAGGGIGEDGSPGEGGNSSVGGGGGGGGGAEDNEGGSIGSTTINNNGGAGGRGGAAAGTYGGSGGSGGGGYDTGDGGDGGSGLHSDVSNGGNGGNSGANGGNGGGGGAGGVISSTAGIGGSGGWGYVNGGDGGSGGGDGGAGLTGTGGVGGVGRSIYTGQDGGAGGQGATGGDGGDGGDGTAYHGGNGGAGGDGGVGSTCFILYVRGDLNVNGITINGQGGVGGDGGNGGNDAGTSGDISGDGGAGGDGGDGSDMVMLCLGTYTTGATINNDGGLGGTGGTGGTGNQNGADGQDGKDGENGRQYVGQLINT